MDDQEHQTDMHHMVFPMYRINFFVLLLIWGIQVYHQNIYMCSKEFISVCSSHKLLPIYYCWWPEQKCVSEYAFYLDPFIQRSPIASE